MNELRRPDRIEAYVARASSLVRKRLASACSSKEEGCVAPATTLPSSSVRYIPKLSQLRLAEQNVARVGRFSGLDAVPKGVEKAIIGGVRPDRHVVAVRREEH